MTRRAAASVSREHLHSRPRGPGVPDDSCDRERRSEPFRRARPQELGGTVGRHLVVDGVSPCDYALKAGTTSFTNSSRDFFFSSWVIPLSIQ